MQINEQFDCHQAIPEKQIYTDSDGNIIVQEKPINIVAEESIMSNSFYLKYIF